MLFFNRPPNIRPRGRRTLLTTGVVGVVAFSLLVGVLPANAEGADTTPLLSAADIAALQDAMSAAPVAPVVTTAATDAVADVAGAPSAAVLAPLVTPSVAVDDGGVASVGDSVASLPTSTDNSLSLSDASTGAAVGLSIVGSTTTAMNGDAAVTQSVDPGTSVVSHVTPDGGIQLINVSQTPAPQVNFAVNISIPVGATWETQADGSLHLVDPTLPVAENILMVAAAPWAVDSNGTQLATHYTVTDGTITQVVDSSTAVFPVVADPTVWWWVATTALCVLAVGSFVVPFGKAALALVSAQRLITSSATLTRLVGALGGLKSAIAAIGKFISDASKLTKLAQAGIKSLFAFGISILAEILGVGSCLGLGKAILGFR